MVEDDSQSRCHVHSVTESVEIEVLSAVVVSVTVCIFQLIRNFWLLLKLVAVEHNGFK